MKTKMTHTMRDRTKKSWKARNNSSRRINRAKSVTVIWVQTKAQICLTRREGGSRNRIKIRSWKRNLNWKNVRFELASSTTRQANNFEELSSFFSAEGIVCICSLPAISKPNPARIAPSEWRTLINFHLAAAAKQSS